MTMKSSLSTLNPFAKSYVPIALREASSEIPDASFCAELGIEKLTITDNSKLKGQKSGYPLATASHSNQVASLKFTDEEFEMDLAFLQMSFPGMSDQSIIDVYTVNDGDLEASIEMLSQLESVCTSDGLPDALDIGDVPETAPSGECSATKNKNMVGESQSSYGSSDLSVRL
ncbi:hypothetical protein V2J09_023461 [Rumex salicifolius]